MSESFHSELKKLVFEGAKRKFLSIEDKVLDRINFELNLIEHINASEYFLVYTKIVSICNKGNIIRTPARGTAGNSLVNYCLDITNINPLEHNLIFERFLNIEFKRGIDIDMDIPLGFRNFLIQKLKEELPSYNIRKLAYNPISLDEKVIKLSFGDKEYSVHPNSILISNNKRELEFESKIYDKHNVLLHDNYPNDLYLLNDIKFDLVGLQYLEKLQELNEKIDKSNCQDDIDLNDSNVFEIFCAGDLLNIFQFNHESFIPILKEFEPQSINDLSIIYALNRTGLKEKIPTVIGNKSFGYDDLFHNDTRVSEILSGSYGEIVFDETYMHIMNKIAGFPLSKADKYRLLLAKNNDFSRIEQIIEEFIDGCYKYSNLNGNDINVLATIILMDAKMAFIKSHSLSYAIVAYWGAYYKTYYRSEFDDVFSKVERPLINRFENF